jgi:hypothetical protein
MFATGQRAAGASIGDIDAAVVRTNKALEVSSEAMCNACSMFPSIADDVFALDFERKTSIPNIFFVYTPRIDKLLLEYIDACGGGDGQSWLRYSKDCLFKDAYACDINTGSHFHYLEQPTRGGAGAVLEPSDYTQNMRAMASILLNLLLTLKYRALEEASVPVVQCWVYAIDQRVEYCAKTDAGTVHVSWFMQRHRADSEQCGGGGDDDRVLLTVTQSAIIDAYRCRGRRFDPFDMWLAVS